jgi:hypothetical protein
VGFELEYRLDGRRVTADQFSRGMVDKARDAALDGARRRIGSIRLARRRDRLELVGKLGCPVHGKRASVSEQRVSGDRFEFDISGCCDESVAQAKRALR